MTQPRRPVKKLSPEEHRKLKEQVLARKKANEEERARKLQKDSEIFRKIPGKILKWVCVVSALFSASYLIDGWLSVSYHQYKINDFEENRMDVISHDGWWVPATFVWVYLNEENSLAINMYKGEFESIQESGVLEVGETPLYGMPRSFRINGSNGEIIKKLKMDYGQLRILPVAIFFFSVLWLLLKPERSSQTIIFGYINMILIPFLLVLTIPTVTEQLADKGIYQMDIRDLQLRD